MNASQAVEAEIQDGISTTIDIALASEGPKSWVRRTATFQGIREPVVFGTHGPFLEHYGVEPGEYPSEATTNEYLAAALASCMTGAFTNALEARGVALNSETLKAVADVNIGPAADDGSWIVRSVALSLTATVPEEKREAAERAHAIYRKTCWVSQTFRGSRCEISSTLQFV